MQKFKLFSTNIHRDWISESPSGRYSNTKWEEYIWKAKKIPGTIKELEKMELQ